MERVQELEKKYHKVEYQVMRVNDNMYLGFFDNFSKASKFMAEYHNKHKCDVVIMKSERILEGAMLVPEEPELSYADMISRLKDIKSLLDILLEEEE